MLGYMDMARETTRLLNGFHFLVAPMVGANGLGRTRDVNARNGFQLQRMSSCNVSFSSPSNYSKTPVD